MAGRTFDDMLRAAYEAGENYGGFQEKWGPDAQGQDCPPTFEQWRDQFTMRAPVSV